VYVPTNHIYVGDVFLLGKQDIIKVNLSVREGLGESSQSPCLQNGRTTLMLLLRTNPTHSNHIAWDTGHSTSILFAFASLPITSF